MMEYLWCSSGGVAYLRVLHSEGPLWLLAVPHGGLPQLLLGPQLPHDLPHAPVLLPDAAHLLLLLLAHAVKLAVESRLDFVDHILRRSQVPFI